MQDTVNKLLTMLYAAPTSPDLWPGALSGLMKLLDLNASAIVRTDLQCKANGIYFSQGIDPEMERLYASGYGNQDVYRPRFLRADKRRGRLLMGDELCTHQEMKKTAFYEDILRKADIRLWCAVATVQTDNIIESVSFYHSWKDEAPGSDKLVLARLITPHLNNALQVRAKLAQLEGLTRDLYSALDHADNGMVLFDQRGLCAFVNAAAKRVLDQRDGLIFSENRLTVEDPQERKVFAELVRRAVAATNPGQLPKSGTLRVTRRRGRPLHLRVTTFSSERLSSAAQFSAMVLIGDPDRFQKLPLQVIEASFGLTPAEARLAQLLLQGNTIAEAAAINGVTKETARSQLKSIFLKTGTRRQGELIGLLAVLPGACSDSQDSAR